jgi:hypothetical protein
MGALLTTTACKDDDDPDPTDEGEVITSVTLSLTPEGKGQDASATIDATSGTPVQNGPLTLKPNTTYDATITLAGPSGDITEEIREEGNEHLFVFTATPAALLTMTAADTDKNNRPIGLDATVTTGEAGTGTLKVVLKHQPGNLKTGTNTTAGETDIEVNFEVIVAN